MLVNGLTSVLVLGPLSPIVRFLVPIILLTIVVYVVYKILT